MNIFFTLSPESLETISASELKSALEKLNWEEFIPEEHGVLLRKALFKNADKNGVNEGHYFATEKLRKHKFLILENPYVHQGDLIAFSISPNGRLFASGSWVGDDYNEGGTMILFDVETGKALSNCYVEGGVGWPDDEDCMQFSPDGKMVGMTFNTNGVGFIDIETNSMPEECYVTDGWDSAPGFCWAQNGNALHVSCWRSGEVKEGLEKIPGCNFTWKSKKESDREYWAPDGKTPFGEDLQPLKQCRAFKNIIVGWNSHNQAYALDEKTLELKWTKEFDRLYFGKSVIVGSDDSGLIIYDPANLKELFKIPEKKQAQVVVSNSESFDPLLAVYDGKSAIAIYKGSEKLCTLKHSLPHQNEIGLRTMAFGLDENLFGCLGSEGNVFVYENPFAPKLIHQSEHSHAEGIFLGTNDTLIVAGADYTCFVNVTDGSVKGKYLYDFPDHGHELIVNGDDASKYTDERKPVFPVRANGETLWGYAFSSGHSLIPVEADHSGLPSWSMQGKCTWPLEWAKFVALKDLFEYAAEPDTVFGKELKAKFKKAASPKGKKQPVEKAKKDSFRFEGDETIEDLYSLLIQTLTTEVTKGYHSHVQDYLCKLSVLMAKKGNWDRAMDLLEKISEPFSKLVAGAWITCMSKQSGKEITGLYDQCKEWFDASLEKHEYLRARAHSMMAAVHALNENEKDAEKCFKQGLKNQDEDSNSGETFSYYLQALTISGNTEKMFTVLKTDEDGELHDAEWLPTLAWIMKHFSVKEVEKLLGLLDDKSADMDFGYIELTTECLVRNKAWDKVDIFENYFSGYSTSEATQDVIRGMAASEKPGIVHAKLDALLEENKKWADSWIEYAILGAELFPDLAEKWFKSSGRDFNALLKESNEKEHFFRNYMRLMQMAIPEMGSKYAETIGKNPKVEFAVEGVLGVLSEMPAGPEREQLIKDAMTWVEKIKEDSSDYWGLLGAQAWRGGQIAEAEACMKKGLDSCKGSSKDLEQERVSDAFAKVGAFDFAHRAWMKNTKKTYRMDDFLKALANQGKIHGLLELIRPLDGADLNHRCSKLRDMICLLEKIKWDDLPQ